jgi:hypothetical protein
MNARYVDGGTRLTAYRLALVDSGGLIDYY